MAQRRQQHPHTPPPPPASPLCQLTHAERSARSIAASSFLPRGCTRRAPGSPSAGCPLSRAACWARKALRCWGGLAGGRSQHLAQAGRMPPKMRNARPLALRSSPQWPLQEPQRDRGSGCLWSTHQNVGVAQQEMEAALRGWRERRDAAPLCVCVCGSRAGRVSCAAAHSGWLNAATTAIAGLQPTASGGLDATCGLSRRRAWVGGCAPGKKGAQTITAQKKAAGTLDTLPPHSACMTADKAMSHPQSSSQTSQPTTFCRTLTRGGGGGLQRG